jgi:uncharacterized membrane protein
LGARRRHGPPPAADWVSSEKIGYVEHIDLAALERIARANGGETHVDAVPGDFVDRGQRFVLMDFMSDKAERLANALP